MTYDETRKNAPMERWWLRMEGSFWEGRFLSTPLQRAAGRATTSGLAGFSLDPVIELARGFVSRLRLAGQESAPLKLVTTEPITDETVRVKRVA